MSYPQQSADDYAAAGYDFFRLNTPLVSGGDIYESAQGARALALGPESDVSRVKVTYFDIEVDNFVNQVILGPDRSMVGGINANVRSTYTPANRPGKILIAPDNLYNPDIAPTASQNVGSSIVIPPKLDVIQYFSNPGALVPMRNDRVHRFQQIPFFDDGANAGAVAVFVPFYGRRFCSFMFRPTSSILAITVEVYGINFPYADLTGVTDFVELFSLDGATLPTSDLTGTYSVGQPSTYGTTDFGNGMFDYLEFVIRPNQTTPHNQAGPFGLITTSDIPVPP